MQQYSLYFAAQVISGERSTTSSETRGTKESRQKLTTREKKNIKQSLSLSYLSDIVEISVSNFLHGCKLSVLI